MHLLDQRTLDRLIPYTLDNNTILDVIRRAITFSDGVETATETYIHSYPCDLQNILMGVDERSRMDIQVGGESVTPEKRAFLNREVDIRIGDYVSPDSGTTKYDVLLVTQYDEHTEIDLKTRQQ